MTSDRKQKQPNSIPIHFFDEADSREPGDATDIDEDIAGPETGAAAASAPEAGLLETDFGGPALAELVASRAELKRLQAALAEAQEGSARRQADF